MGLFSYNFDSNAPEFDQPRKKGAWRLLELLDRDLLRFFLAGLISLAGLLPFLGGMFFAVESRSVLAMLLTGVAGGMVAVPQVCALADTLLRSMCDEPGWQWGVYRRAWKQNVKASLLPGALFGAVSAAQIFALFHVDTFGSTVLTLILLAVSAMLSFGLASYLLPMLVLMELPLGHLFRNTVLLFIIYLPYSLLAALIQAAWFAFLLLFMPMSSLLLLLGNFWLPMLLAYQFVYGPLDERFRIEEAHAQLQMEKLEKLRRENEDRSS